MPIPMPYNFSKSLMMGGMCAALLLSSCQNAAPIASVQQDAEAASLGTASTVSAQSAEAQMNMIAEDYVKLSLEIGTKEEGYIDAYYGPAEWKAEAEANPRGLVDLANAVIALEERLDLVDESQLDRLEKKRRAYLLGQLTAARTRLLMLQGETLSFREEALGLFGVVPDIKPLTDLETAYQTLEKLVPGNGPLTKRITKLFPPTTILPKEKLQPVFDAAIAECRRRTLQYIDLPDNERFTMRFVNDKPWSGYNYYQGDFNSKIEINTDLPIAIGRAVDLGCHEGYPGHHVFNMLLEKNLAKERGWPEYQVYPLYSPQSVIAEGSANYGIELAFPDGQQAEYENRILAPLAGISIKDGPDITPEIAKALSGLSGQRFAIARAYIDKEIDREEAVRLTMRYGFRGRKSAEQSIRFLDTYRTYVINYGLGLDMVRDFVEAGNVDEATKWARMKTILSEPTLPADLVVK
jgi:hypothetical protein